VTLSPEKTKGILTMEKNENGFIARDRNINSSDAQRESNSNSRLNCRGERDEGDASVSPNCSDWQLAMVYSPFQCWRMLYSVEDALSHGTLFEELFKPLEEC